MSMPGKRPKFDQYAGKYEELHKASTRASGEDPEYFAAYKANVMASWLGAAAGTPGLRVLDFGCGVGGSIPHIRNAFPAATIHGADPSPESVRMAEENFGSSAGFSVIEGTRLGFEDAQFDVVLVGCVFHHIPVEERAAWMGEIRRVLRPDGHAFIFEHNMLNPLTMKAVRDCPFDDDAILLPRAELLSLARRAGFSSTTSRYIVFFPRFLSMLRPVEPSLGWLPLGAQYFVHASP
ncbi:methyltransferase domain-containing protein [Lysobacter sp. S4-A87]|uniref:class I SAM-dependent methyltransferase n=1 Tax=Lysobacter sp. S4-A87 TaxID=2925843 RepID=UPI001F53794E|nr:class I SAM-dependent methyltransferase [Lysobacter sp. S4-A87]UNK48888.1 methyltransferase domain-containing protein [Lysobacter sp. S4-A87]